jgi:hypothetical protein
MVRFLGQFARVSIIPIALIVLCMSHGYAEAQPPPPRGGSQPAIGFQGGASIDPEQVFGGVFWRSPAIANRFHIRPGIDGGFGNDLRVATVNIDFVALFPLGSSGWNLVQGGGPVIALIKVTGVDDTEVSAGGSYVIGFSHIDGFFTEFRIGGGNTPNLKIGAGYQLRF